MARVQTPARERAAQREELVETVSARVGHKVTLAAAERFQRRQPHLTKRITRRHLELNEDDLEPAGVALAGIKDFRILPGGYAQLQLVTNAHEFGDIFQEIALVASSRLVVMGFFLIPRPDDDEDGDDDGDA